MKRKRRENPSPHPQRRESRYRWCQQILVVSCSECWTYLKLLLIRCVQVDRIRTGIPKKAVAVASAQVQTSKSSGHVNTKAKISSSSSITVHVVSAYPMFALYLMSPSSQSTASTRPTKICTHTYDASKRAIDGNSLERTLLSLTRRCVPPSVLTVYSMRWSSMRACEAGTLDFHIYTLVQT